MLDFYIRWFHFWDSENEFTVSNFQGMTKDELNTMYIVFFDIFRILSGRPFSNHYDC
jgi:hypothetical protein